MLEFHAVTVNDKKWIEERLSSRSKRSCEYSFGNIFSYKEKLDIYVCDYEGCLIVKCISGNRASYMYPAGDGNIDAALAEIVAEAENSGMKCYMYGLSAEDALNYERLFPIKDKPYPNRDTFDYVYNNEDLVNLSGKKYQPKRNHISFFKKNYYWTYEKICGNNISECLAMSRKWLENYESEDKTDLESEYRIIRCVFDNYFTLGYKGGLIRKDGEVVAFTMGEELDSDTFCVHFEKAFAEYRGLYPLINQQFVENELSDYKYINREDDVGLENLRKAKLSYYPAFLFEKYEVVISYAD